MSWIGTFYTDTYTGAKYILYHHIIDILLMIQILQHILSRALLEIKIRRFGQNIHTSVWNITFNHKG